MLTLLINESNPLDGLFANSTTGGVGTVPDITVADAGQAVSVQSFTRAGGIITDSFVAGDALHIGIGDGVNAPVCYVALSSASPAVGTMPINTAGMVALFAATVANQLSLTLAVVRTRGAYTNTIFSAPIVIRRSAINISTAVPTPSILGTGVSAALQVAINTALGFVRLDASARYPALDGSQITNLAGGSLTVGTTAITSGTTTRVLFDNAGVLGEYAISGTGSVAMTTSPSFTTPTIGDGTEAAPSLSFTSDANTGVYRPAADTVGIVGGGHDILRLTDVASATDYLEIKNGIGVGSPLHVLAEGASANIGVHLQPKGSGLFTISDGTDFNKGIRFRSSSSAASAITLLDAVSTAGRVVTLPDATGTLALVSGDLGTPSAIVLTNASGTANININGTLGATTPSTVAGTTGTFSDALSTTGPASSISTSGEFSNIFTTGADASIFTSGEYASIYTTGADASIFTSGANAHIYTSNAGAYILTRSTFKLNGGTFVTTLSHAATADRAIAFPDAAGTLLLADGSGAALTALNASNISSGTLAAARGGTGVSNTGTITLGGNLVTTGAFNTTFAQAATTTVTLPSTSATMARTDAAQTFTGVQSMTSPDIATSITTPSTTFAIANATATTLNIGGAATTIAMGAAGAGTMNIPFTTAASSAITGSLKIGNGTAATNVGIGGGNVNIGGTLIVGGTGSFTGSVGIGSAAPVSQLHVTTNATNSTRGAVIDQHTTDAAGALSFFRKSRGTLASPTTVANGDYVGSFFFSGYTSNGAYTNPVGFGARVNGTVTSTSIPTDIFFGLSSGVHDEDAYTNGNVKLILKSTSVAAFSSSMVLGITSSGGANGTVDTGLSRDSAGVWAFGTGAAASLAGSWKATNGTLSGTLAVTGATTLSGDVNLSKTITAAATTGAQTINKNSGAVNFAAAATSLVVTNSLCTVNSVVTATIGTNDATASGVKVVPAAGSFTIYLGVAPTAETRVYFRLTN